MTLSYLKVEEKLNDASNIGPWKAKLYITLEEHEILEYVEGTIVDPLENSSATVKSKHKNGEIKARKIILILLVIISLLMFLVWRKLKNCMTN